jgi:hypothetical protein
MAKQTGLIRKEIIKSIFNDYRVEVKEMAACYGVSVQSITSRSTYCIRSVSSQK